MNRKLIPFVFSLLLTGCATVEVFDPQNPPEYVLTRRAEFYAWGPAQAGPPQKVEKDTPVHVYKKDSGYAYVRLADKRGGYIEWDALKATPAPAPAAVVVPNNAPYNPVPVDEIVEVPLPDFQAIPDELPAKLRRKR